METQDVRLPNDYPTDGPRALPHFGSVYFIYCAGRIKIGRAEEVARRLSQISTTSPFEPTLLLAASAPRNAEANLHARFSEDRLRREWFKLSEHLRRYLVRRLTPEGLAAFRKAEEDFVAEMCPEPEAPYRKRKWTKPPKRCHHRTPLSRSCSKCSREASLRVYETLLKELRETAA